MGTQAIYPVAESVPFDNETNGFLAEDTQAAIEEAKSNGTSSRYVLTLGVDATARRGKWLEIRQNTSSKTNPYVLSEPTIIKAFSISTKYNSTGTMKLYINNTIAYQFSLSSSKRGWESGLNIVLVPGDEVSMKVTSGSFSRPSAFISFKVNL